MTDTVRRVVDLMLADELFGATGSAPDISLGSGFPLPRSPRSETATEPQPHGEGTVRMLTALGLLEAAAADEWLARLAIAREGWHQAPAASREQTRLAETFMRLLTERLRSTDDTAERETLLDQLSGAFGLYLQAGLLAPQDEPTWSAHIEDALGKTVEDFELFDVHGLDPDELDAPTGEEHDYPGQFLALMPAELARYDGLCITAAELHTNSFTLHWHLITSGTFKSDDSFTMGELEIADDIGTEYADVMPGGAGWSERAEGPYAVIGVTRCDTPVPDRARELRISKDKAAWRIPLTR